MEVASWLEIAKTFGVTACVLAAFMFGAWKIVRWVGQELVIPLRDRFILRLEMFFSKLETTIAKIDTNVEAVTENLEQQTTSLKLIETHVRENKDGLPVACKYPGTHAVNFAPKVQAG